MEIVVEILFLHRQSRVAVRGRQKVEGNVVGEGHLQKALLDRAENEVARVAAGVAAPKRVDVVVRKGEGEARRAHLSMLRWVCRTGSKHVHEPATSFLLRDGLRGEPPVEGAEPRFSRGARDSPRGLR